MVDNLPSSHICYNRCLKMMYISWLEENKNYYFYFIITKTYRFNSTNDSLDGSISKVKTGLVFFSVDKYVTRGNKKSNLEIFLKKYTKCLL